ncbi:PPE domain-containing protein, partial [Actinophytocola sp.]|uniref:PPE domain-containing protein n=1 Tax=Actinophytocola sp. TaxID=1872138 RepID=UPI003D6B9671
MTPPTEQQGSQPAAPPADGARWRGHTHKELYLLLHNGPGPAASAEPSRRWAEIATALGEIGEDLQKALEHSAASWSGKAAGAAYDRLSVTAAWATGTGADAAGMRTAVETQAENIARARADMPAPEDVPPVQPDPTAVPPMQVVQGQADLEGAEATASSAEERAYEVMAAYELNTNTTTAAMSTFEAPPVLDHRDEVHQGQAAVGTQHTHGAGLLNPGHGHGHTPGTGGASTPWVEADRHRPFTPTQGSFSGVLDPLLPGRGGRSGQRRESSRSRPLAPGLSTGAGTGFGSGSGGANGSSPGSGSVPVAGPSSVAGGAAGAAQPKAGPANVGGMPASDLQ